MGNGIKTLLNARIGLWLRSWLKAVPPQHPDAMQRFLADVVRLAGQDPTSAELKATVAENLLRTDIRIVKLSLRQMAQQLQRNLANEQAYEMVQAFKAEASKNQKSRTGEASDGNQALS